MANAQALMQENVWLQRQRFEEAEAFFYAVQAGTVSAQAAQAAASQVCICFCQIDWTFLSLSAFPFYFPGILSLQ